MFTAEQVASAALAAAAVACGLCAWRGALRPALVLFWAAPLAILLSLALAARAGDAWRVRKGGRTWSRRKHS